MNAYKNFVKQYHVASVCAAFLTVLAALFWTINHVQAQNVRDHRDTQYAVVIERVTTSMGDQGGGPEFFAEIYHPDHDKWHKTTKVAGRNFNPPATKQDCSGNLCVTHSQIPDWGIVGDVPSERKDRIKIRLTEEDKWASDDHVDIARGSDKDLEIYVRRDGRKPYVYFEGQWLQCPRTNQVTHPHYVCHITSSGDRGDKATVRLSIQFPPAPTP